MKKNYETHVLAMYAVANGKDWGNTVGDSIKTIAGIDVFTTFGFVKNFSKYNVGLVWYYYNLWKFNFIVGFGAVFTIFGMFISIIIGLMIRLIKGIIYFLVYPATLGLAGLDNFSAFKSWRKEFIKLSLSAFGSIIGMNLFFLVLPYLQTITFFNIELLDNIISVIMMITGIVIVKDIMGFISGFVGGGDVMADGDKNKGAVGKSLMKAGTAAVAIGGGAAKIANPMLNATVSRAKQGIMKARTRSDEKKAIKAAGYDPKTFSAADAESFMDNDIAARERGAQSWEQGVDFAAAARNKAEAEKYMQEEEAKFDKKLETDGSLQDEYNSAYNANRASGMNDSEAAKKAKQDILKNKDRNYSAASEAVEKNGFSDDEIQKLDKAKALREDGEKIKKNRDDFLAETDRIKEIRTKNYLTEDGKASYAGTRAAMRDQYRAGFGTLKNAKLMGNLGIDIGKQFMPFVQAASNKKYNEKGEVVGENVSTVGFRKGERERLQNIANNTGGNYSQAQINTAKADIKKIDDGGSISRAIGDAFRHPLKTFGDAVTKFAAKAPKGEKEKTADKIQADAAKDMTKATDTMKTDIAQMREDIKKMTEAILKKLP